MPFKSLNDEYFLSTRGYNTFIKNKYCLRNVKLIQIIIWFSYIYKEILCVRTISIFSRKVHCNGSYIPFRETPLFQGGLYITFVEISFSHLRLTLPSDFAYIPVS